MRRRTLIKLLTVATILAAAVPPLLSIFALEQAENQERTHTARTIVEAARLHAEQIFGVAESSLQKLARLTDARAGDNSIEALRAFVFAQKYLRGIGIVQDGKIVATNEGRLDPPWPIPPEELTSLPSNKLTVLPPTSTPAGGRSVLAVWPVRPGAALVASINPALFDDVVWIMAARDHVHLGVRLPNGERLAEFGAPKPPDPTIRVESPSIRFNFLVHGSIGESSLTHTLARHGWFAAAPGLLVDVLLVALLVYYARRASSLESDLREASSFGEVFAEYQPQCDLATGACVGAEILMRWKNPSRGTISPDVFIPAAEKLGIVRELTLALAGRAASDLGSWISRHPSVHLSINLSAEHCRREDAVREIATTLGTAIPSGQIVYELTERGLIARSEAPGLVYLETLAREGSSALALDDFGTGYSSLGCLNQFKFRYLKIDKSFVDAIRDAHTCEGTLDQVITLAQSLGMILIAEGVEHEWQAVYLRNRGVQIGQGWLFSKSLNADEFRGFVEKGARV